MIKSLLLTLSCVIGSGSGALQKNAPTFNNEPPQKNLIDRTSSGNYDYWFIDPLKTTSHVANDQNKEKYFNNDTLQINENRRVAKITENINLNGTLVYATLTSMTYKDPYSNGRLLQADSTLIISIKRKALTQEVYYSTYSSQIPYFTPMLPNIDYTGEDMHNQVLIYTYNGLANNDVRNGIGYESYYYWNNLISGQIDPNINANTINHKYTLNTTQNGGETSTTYNYEWLDNETQTNQSSSWAFNQDAYGTGVLNKNSTNPIKLTNTNEQSQWQTYLFHFSTRALYNENRTFTDFQQRQLNKYCGRIQNTILRVDKVAPTETTINYEAVDVAPIFWQILTMPFTFIATAFNFTLFEGTIYEINPASILLALLSALVIAWILKKLITRS